MSSDHLYKLFFDKLLEKSEDGFVIIDENGIILDMNEQYCSFLGRDRDDIIGQPIGNIITTTSMYDVLKNRHEGDNNGGIYFQPYTSDDTREEQQTYAIANRFCVFNESDDLIGAMAQVKFKERALDIAEKVMKAELEFYKLEYHKDLDTTGNFSNLMGTHPKMNELRMRGMKVAKTDFPVLITGETGTGKELIAKAIHLESPRRDNPLICINCGAIPQDLIEAELFGYEEGAFTGARRGGRIGKFQLANNGTIFLDEIGDLPLPLQVKLLRVLQEKEVEPIGASRPVPIDVRVISATRQNLQEMMQKGTFRSDLYYRLAVINMEAIPLREHPDDILLYANNYLEELNRKYKTSVVLSPAVNKCLLKYSWPGNVRELQNVIASAYASCDTAMPVINLTDLPSKIASASEHLHLSDAKGEKKLHLLMQNYETALITEALQQHNNNVAQTAADLGIERSLLYKKMKKLHIDICREIKKPQ